MELSNEKYHALVVLARRALHTAYVWNDHNFGCARNLARASAETLGINNLESANDFMASLPVQHIEEAPQKD